MSDPIYDQIALTGRTLTFLGRTRTVTAHRWMVARKRVRILVTYKGGDHYWVEIIPIEPRLRVLTSYVLRAWDAKTNRLIYDHKKGPADKASLPAVRPARLAVSVAGPQLGLEEHPTGACRRPGGPLRRL